MLKVIVLAVAFACCAVSLTIAHYDAHYAERMHHARQIG
jgi:hypothetical protein